MASTNTESTKWSQFGRLQPRALFERALMPSGSAHASSGTSSQTIPTLDGAMEGLLAQVFPEFQLLGPIGRGGSGTVYRAEHRQLKRTVALKVLTGGRALSVEAIARFEREIQAAGKLDDPRIVRAFDGGHRGGIWFLAMEYVRGVDFSAISKRLGPLSIPDACELVRQAALALQHAHERDMVHRDVKPSNFMLTSDASGQAVVKVLDFGLAQLSHLESQGGELTVTGDFLGTIDYVAPEQITNPRTVDQRADVFGLGATLFRLLTGQSPNSGTETGTTMIQRLLSIAQRPVPSVATIRDDLPRALVMVVDRMLALDRSMRFDTAQEVARALEPFVEGHQIGRLLIEVLPEISETVAPVGSNPMASRGATHSQTRHRFFPAFLLAATVMLAGGGIWWSTRKESKVQLQPAVPVTVPVAEPHSMSQTVALGPVAIHPRSIDLGPDGAFYGGAIFGGKYNQGVLFRFQPPSITRVIADFTGTNGPTLGRMPGRQLRLGRDGWMYGVTERGGAKDLGTLFRFNPREPDRGITTLWEFQGTDGSEPLAGLIEDISKTGVFYGGTQYGGASDAGTLFKLEVTGETARVHTLKQFTGNGGEAPGKRLVANLVQTSDGALYGSCPDGGEGTGGVVFRLSPSGEYTVLSAFGLPPSRLANPVGGLTLGKDGTIYGHCRVERDGYGALFRVNPAGDVEILARFGNEVGSQPGSTLLAAPDGSLYGTTMEGGEHFRGTLYRYKPGAGLSRVASFYDVGGQITDLVWGTPVIGADGLIYGSFEGGGSDRAGLLYRIESNGELRVLVQFAAKPR